MKSALAHRDPLPRCLSCGREFERTSEPSDFDTDGYCSARCYDAATPPTLHEGTPILCSECREPVEHHDDGNPPFYINGRSSRWRHVRTKSVRCSPLCACGHPGVHALGSESFDGAGVRFRAREFVCERCLGVRRKSQLMVERL